MSNFLIRAYPRQHLADYDRPVLRSPEFCGVCHKQQTRELMDEPGRVHQVGNSRKQGTLVLEGTPLDRHGNLLRRHELWNKAGGKGKR